MNSRPSHLVSPFVTNASPRNAAHRRLRSIASGAVERVLALRELDAIYAASVGPSASPTFADAALGALDVALDLPDADRARIPRQGGVVIVANHPHGAVEGIAILSILLSVRSDVRIMANTILERIPALREHSIFVDPFGGREAARANIKGLRQSIEWVRGGGMLVIFPAGEVSHISLGRSRVVDPAWSPTVARIIRKTGASALPLYFDGQNSALFQIAGLIHPRLRTVMLPRELLRRRGKVLPVRIGSPIPFNRLEPIACDVAMTRYLRERTYFLAHRMARARRSAPAPRAVPHEPVVPAGPVDGLREEIERLPAERVLLTHGDHLVAHATADLIPRVLREIGRLRELAFREVGEGTGCAIDLDRFDQYYDHLFLWNRVSGEIIGAYRIGRVDAIVDAAGIEGLYTASLFRYRHELLAGLGGAMELGRSFVAPGHQRNFNALPLLWKGIGAYILRHPGYRTLFGPVSISSDFSATSRELIASFLRKHLTDPALARHVRPRVPFICRSTFNGGSFLPAEADTLGDLGMLVEEVEGEGRGIPVLLRQYLKLGGRLLGLSVDREFHDALDALIAVDLTRTDPALLARYMGREGGELFLRRHGIVPRRAGAEPLAAG